MKAAKCFDVYDDNITAEIYTLLFSDTIVELTSNDTWYNLRNFYQHDHDFIDSDEWTSHLQKLWEVRLARGWRNCFKNGKGEREMESYIKNPNRFVVARYNFKLWLKEQGVVEGEDLFVKIWW